MRTYGGGSNGQVETVFQNLSQDLSQYLSQVLSRDLSQVLAISPSRLAPVAMNLCGPWRRRVLKHCGTGRSRLEHQSSIVRREATVSIGHSILIGGTVDLPRGPTRGWASSEIARDSNCRLAATERGIRVGIDE
jgi:hypothetical protein